MIPNKPPGRTSRATPEYRAALRTAVNTSPRELGYGFSVWSLGRLNTHLVKETGIGFSDDQLGRIMRTDAFQNLVPRFERARNRTPVLPPLSLAV